VCGDGLYTQKSCAKQRHHFRIKRSTMVFGLQVTNRIEMLPTESQEREGEFRQVKSSGLDPFRSA